MTTSYQLIIVVLSVISLLNIALVVALWMSLKKRVRADHNQPQPQLDPNAIKQLEEKALKHLEWRVAGAIREFDASLAQTAGQLDQKLASLVVNVIDREMVAYRESLEKSRIKAIENLDQVQQAADELQKKEKAALAAQIEAEKKRVLDQFDQKLSDVMASYLIESLGKEIDLGAQTKFLLATLDKNKEQLKKDILSEY